MNRSRNGEDIEIPWALVREFSKSSALPPALQTSLGNHSRTTVTPGIKQRDTSMSVDTGIFAGERSQCYNTPQFPSLPASPDLVSPFRQHPGKKVPYNVLHAYIVGSTPPVAPVNTTFTSKTSPRVNASKKLSQSKVESQEESSRICPTVRRLVKTRQGKRRQIRTSEEEGESARKEECHFTEFPQVSPLGYTTMHQYSQMWSPVEEKKLVDIWKKGPNVKKRSGVCASTNNKCATKNQVAPQYLLSTTNNRGRDFTSNERASMFRYREVITTSKSEPPTLVTSPLAYINTWLDAGGEVPKFLKSV